MNKPRSEKVADAIHKWSIAQPKVIGHKKWRYIANPHWDGDVSKHSLPAVVANSPVWMAFLTVEAMANLYWPWLHLIAEEYSTSTIGEFATNFLLRHGEAFIPEKPMGSEQVQISGLSEEV